MIIVTKSGFPGKAFLRDYLGCGIFKGTGVLRQNNHCLPKSLVNFFFSKLVAQTLYFETRYLNLSSGLLKRTATNLEPLKKTSRKKMNWSILSSLTLLFSFSFD